MCLKLLRYQYFCSYLMQKNVWMPTPTMQYPLSGWMLSASDKLGNVTAVLPTPQLRMLSIDLPLCPGNFPLQVEEALKPTQ